MICSARFSRLSVKEICTACLSQCVGGSSPDRTQQATFSAAAPIQFLTRKYNWAGICKKVLGYPSVPLTRPYCNLLSVSREGLFGITLFPSWIFRHNSGEQVACQQAVEPLAGCGVRSLAPPDGVDSSKLPDKRHHGDIYRGK